MRTFAEILVVCGSALAMIGGIGVVRFGDVFSRMHAAAKAPTLALILVSIGAAIEIGTLLAATTLTLVVILQLLSSPVGAHALSRASRRQISIAVDDVDELTDHERGGS
jgi:multicomponent Na+:H+ antiporter subunit G